jgi:nucleotide-binding universal stress UspA family protein
MPYSHLLVPIDGSSRSEQALRHALQLAQALGARITVLHVQPHGPVVLPGLGDRLDAATLASLMKAREAETQQILEVAAAITAPSGVPTTCEQVTDELPHRAIVAEAQRLGCDLILMASHGRRGLSGLLLGSEAQRVLVQAPCPVLIYR